MTTRSRFRVLGLAACLVAGCDSNPGAPTAPPGRLVDPATEPLPTPVPKVARDRVKAVPFPPAIAP